MAILAKRRLSKHLKLAEEARARGEINNFTVLCWFIENVQRRDMTGFFSGVSPNGSRVSLNLADVASLKSNDFKTFFSSARISFGARSSRVTAAEIRHLYHIFDGGDCFSDEVLSFSSSLQKSVKELNFEELHELYLRSACAAIFYQFSDARDKWIKLQNKTLIRAAKKFPSQAKDFIASSVDTNFWRPADRNPVSFFKIGTEVAAFVTYGSYYFDDSINLCFADTLKEILIKECALAASQDGHVYAFKLEDFLKFDPRKPEEVQLIENAPNSSAESTVSEMMALYDITAPDFSVNPPEVSDGNVYVCAISTASHALLSAVRSFKALN